jgi:hypothetical protein
LAGLHRSRYSTANTQAEDIAALQKQLANLAAQNSELLVTLGANKKSASRVITEDSLGLGPFRLPEGIDAKDVLWRLQEGLDLQQATQAALNQKKHDDRKEAEAKEAASKQPTPSHSNTQTICIKNSSCFLPR